MVELESKGKNEIPVYEMEDGHIGVITIWAGRVEVIGSVVQRFGNYLLHIGKPYTDRWDNPFEDEFYKSGEYRVRILKEGEKLVIKNNQ